MPVRRSARLRSSSGLRRDSSAGASNTTKSLPTPCIFVKSMRIAAKDNAKHRARGPEGDRLGVPGTARNAHRAPQLTQRRADLEQATVHDRENTGLHRPLGGSLVDDTFLQ